MKCPQCGKDNKKGAQFCKFCGASLSDSQQHLTVAFLLKSFFFICVAIFVFYIIYLFVLEPFHYDLADKIATKF